MMTVHMVATKTTNHLANVFIAFGNADLEIRMLNIYRRELAIANSEAAPLKWRQQSAEICADIVAWLGFTPEVTSNTDSAPPAHTGVRSGQTGR